MKNLHAILLASVFMCSTTVVFAADATGGDMPPAHQQKKEVPNTTKNGDYLQEQPDNNNGSNATNQSGDKHSKPGNIEKSKRFHEKPAEGGTGVNNK